MQACATALKSEVAKHPAMQGMSYLSTNDVLMGLSWLLSNEAAGKSRPGQGPKGHLSTALFGMDLSRHGLPAELHPGSFVGNFSQARMGNTAAL